MCLPDNKPPNEANQVKSPLFGILSLTYKTKNKRMLAVNKGPVKLWIFFITNKNAPYAAPPMIGNKKNLPHKMKIPVIAKAKKLNAINQ